MKLWKWSNNVIGKGEEKKLQHIYKYVSYVRSVQWVVSVRYKEIRTEKQPAEKYLQSTLKDHSVSMLWSQQKIEKNWFLYFIK